MGGLEGPPKPPALRLAAEPRSSASAGYIAAAAKGAIYTDR